MLGSLVIGLWIIFIGSIPATGQTLRDKASLKPSKFEENIKQDSKKFTLALLSTKQQRWLAMLPPLRVGVYQSSLTNIHNSDELSNLSDAYIDYFERVLRLRFKRIPVDSAAQAIKMLRSGKLDITTSAQFEDESDLFDFTIPYESDPLMIVVRQDAFPLERKADLAGHRVAVIDYATSLALEHSVPAIHIVRAPSTYAGMRLVAQREVDAFVGNLASIGLNIRQDFARMLTISGSTGLKQRLVFGISKPYEPLIPIINRALDTMLRAERQKIRSQWLASHHNIDVNWPSVLWRLVPIALTLLTIIAALLYGYTRLQREMKRRLQAERAKDAFLAMMSHEIRTPMNSVLGLVEILRDRQADAEQQQMLDMVHESAAALLQILDDILDFSKIEAEQLLIENRPFDLRVLCDSVAGLLASQAHAKGLKMRIVVAADVAAQMIGDRVRIRQILVNLLSNAIKFTDTGHIRLSITAASGLTSTSQKLMIQVSDTGAGIAPEALKSLFKPFVQAESSISRRYGGTGLGLAICQRLVRLMDGDISIESTLARGTTVHFEIECPIHPQPPTAYAAPAPCAFLDVMDHERASGAIEYLGALGYRVDEKTERAGDALRITDCAPPDGLNLNVAERTIILTEEIIATGYRIERDAVLLSVNPLFWRACQTACTAVQNPLQADAAQSAIALSEPFAQVPYTDAPPTDAPRILVAEDHLVNRTLLQHQLARLGYLCDAVSDGTQALAALTQHSYALLITDCQMPNLDGYQLAAHIRADEQAAKATRALPILAITANTLHTEQARCFKAGINDYLIKPVQLDALAQRISQWIAPPKVRKKTNDMPAALTEDDVDALMMSFKSLYKDDPVKLRALIATFTDTLRADLIKLHHQLDAPLPLDRPLLRQWIHRQTGAFALLGQTPLTRTFDALRIAAQHASDDALRADARVLANMLEIFAQQLESCGVRMFDHQLHS